MWDTLDPDDPKCRAPIQPPPPNIQTKNTYDALKALDVYEQDQQGEHALAVHGGYWKETLNNHNGWLCYKPLRDPSGLIVTRNMLPTGG